jgi:hypothetical protein
VHLILHWLGLDSASGTAYLAWSGALSDLGELTLVGALAGIYRKHACHTRWCFRFGHYDFTDEQASVTYRLCRRCHPAHSGDRLTRRHIARIHERNRSKEGRP